MDWYNGFLKYQLLYLELGKVVHDIVIRAETQLQHYKVLEVPHDYRKAVVDFHV